MWDLEIVLIQPTRKTYSKLTDMNFWFYFIYIHKGRNQAKDIRKQDPELNIWAQEGAMKFFTLPLPILLGPNIRLRILFSITLILHSYLNVRHHVSHPYSTTSNIIVLYILIYEFLERNLEDKRFLNWRITRIF